MGPWRLPTGLFTALALAGGIRFGPEVTASSWILAGILGSALVVFPARRTMSRGLSGGSFAGLMLAASAAGALRAEPPMSFPFREHAILAGRVLAWEWRESGVSATLRVHAVDGRVLRRPGVVRVYAPASWGRIAASPWLCAEGRLEPERGATVPGARIERRFSGVCLVDRGASPRWGPGQPDRWAAVRDHISAQLETGLTGFPRRFATAMLLGRSRSLTEEERRTFRRTGTSHLVAVSGLHVTVVAGLAALLAAGFPRRARWVGVVAAACSYAAIAGGAASAVRAAAIAAGAAVGAALHRPRPAPAWLALALPWLLWSSPSFLHAVGFRLSVAAVAGILFVVDWGAPWLQGRARFLTPLAVSLGAQWGTLPILVQVFGAVSPLATLPNAVVVPGAALVLPAALFGVLAGFAGWTTQPFFDAAAALSQGILAVLQECDRVLPYRAGLPDPGPLPAFLVLGVVAGWFSLDSPRRSRGGVRRGAAILALLAAGLVFLPRAPRPGPWVAFLDVGQGDAAVFRLGDGTVWVVDVGDDRGPGDAARRAVLPFLSSRGVRAVDGLVISHRHRDHVGALASFLEGVPVRRVFDAGIGPSGGTSGVVDSLLHAHGLWPCLAAAGDTLHGGAGALVVAVHPRPGEASPEEPRGRSLNDASLAIEVRDGPMEILFAGDMESRAEAACTAVAADRRVDWIKVPHHGSRTSSTDTLLAVVRPVWAVVSVGEGNRFGHPAPSVLDRYRQRGTQVFRTDLDGTVLVEWRGGSPRIRTVPPRTPETLP